MQVNVYEAGGFFAEHLDKPTNPKQMVGTLLVCLPSLHTGGNLVVKHNGAEERFDFAEKSGASPYTLHPTPCTLHPTPYTLHPTHYTPHPTPYTLHPAPYTLHPTPYTPHPTPYTLHPTPHTPHPTS